MTERIHDRDECCGRLPRRAFLSDFGLGFTGLALGAMLADDGIVRAAEPTLQAPAGRMHVPPRANQ